MTNPYFSKIDIWRIPEMLVTEALAEMAIDGRQGNEGIALFLGRDDHASAEVTHLVKLRGPGYGIDLSPTDHAYGIKAPYYLSLVAPDYALSTAPLQRWGVHVFMESQGYVRLNAAEVGRRLQVVPRVRIPVITVGVEDGY